MASLPVGITPLPIKLVETYDAAWQTHTIADRSGYTKTLTYSDASTPVTIAPMAGLLIRVTDSFGRQLNFTYDANSRLITLDRSSRGPVPICLRCQW